jgi:DNA (cytosine-5)-methyltransferase 1
MSKKVLDLFCGCGGLSLGFEMAGCDIRLGVDDDEAALTSFAKNHSNSNALNTDLSNGFSDELKKNIESNIDIVIGGPPCQGFSLSGLRKLDDPRNTLVSSFIDVVKEVQPQAFTMENVPGLISLYGGSVKGFILKRFKKIGYSVSYKPVLAADYGIPQSRKRVIFVGLKDESVDFEFPQVSHYSSDSLFKTKYVTMQEALSDLPTLESWEWSEKMAYVLPPQNEYQRWCRENSEFIYNHIGTNHTAKTRKIIGLVPEGGNYKDLPKKYRETRKFNVAWTRYNSKEPAGTIDTGHRHHFHFKFNRVLTVREKARIQSFPDNFIFYGNKSEQNRQVGNAVPPLLGKAIAQRLIPML